MEQKSEKVFLVGAAASETSFDEEGCLNTLGLPKLGTVVILNDI